MTTVRAILKSKAITAINLLGLSLGMACVIGISSYIFEEWKVDRYHQDLDRIYRILVEEVSEGSSVVHTGIAGNFGPAIESDLPEVEYAVRIVNPSYISTWVYHMDKAYRQRFCAADPSILQLFDLPLVEGDLGSIFSRKEAVAITETMAKKYFDELNPLGQTLRVEGFWEGEYVVTGVLRDLPQHSNLQFDILSGQIPDLFDQWNTTDWRPVETYIKLSGQTSGVEVERKLPQWLARYVQRPLIKSTYHLQPLKRVHLYTTRDYGIAGFGNILTLQLLTIIGAFILAIASFNFLNLATAQANERRKEVGVRKISGASKFQITLQFLFEAQVTAFLSLLAAIVLIWSLLPIINRFIEKTLIVGHLTTPSGILWLIAGTICIGLLAGIYPALVLAGFGPSRALKVHWINPGQSFHLRKILVIFQFVITVVLFVSSLTIYRQSKFLHARDWGFNSTEVVSMPLFMVDPEPMYTANWLGLRQKAVKEAFLQHPSIEAASVSHVIPPLSIPTRVLVPSYPDPIPMQYIYADKDFLDTYQIELKEGRNFDRELLSDSIIPGILINEAAVRLLNWDDPIGRNLRWEGTDADLTVIGVISDFLNRDLSQPIQPLFLTQMSQPPQFLSVRLRIDDLDQTLSFLRQQWEYFLPTRPFEYQFADDYLAQLFAEHKRMGRLMAGSAFASIFIACLGLFGLVTFATKHRVKEIGIRRVLGASVLHLVGLLSKQFMRLIIIALIIAWPIVWFLMESWLNRFAWRIDLHWSIFLVTGLATIIITLGVVGTQAIRASLAHPMQSLRTE